MKFKKGELVVHAKGTIYPHKYLQGVVVRSDLFENEDFKTYRVFWYTTGRYQNIGEGCLQSLDESLTT